jgi:hypothetical protein
MSGLRNSFEKLLIFSADNVFFFPKTLKINHQIDNTGVEMDRKGSFF